MTDVPPPFVVFALPRSRTFWLSKVLSVSPWDCGHEQIRYLRGLEDIKSWLASPYTGTVETAGASWWRTLRDLRPDARVATIRRAPGQVLDSLLRTGLPFNPEILYQQLLRQDTKLDQLESRWPGIMRMDWEALSNPDALEELVEHLCGYQPQREWLNGWMGVNAQVPLGPLLRYCHMNSTQLSKLAGQIKLRTIASMSRDKGPRLSELVIAEEPFSETFLRDATKLFEEHCCQVGEAPDNWKNKNIDLGHHLESIEALSVVTARSNNRMFGYLLTVIGPAMDHRKAPVGIQTLFYSSPLVRGCGVAMQRFARDTLAKRGVGEIIIRSGPRGRGPGLAAVARRLGAQPWGELFRLDLAEEPD